MIRGTTPELKFVLPIEIAQIQVAYITVKQNGKVVLEKNMSECEVGENYIKYRMTQNETLALRVHMPIDIQLRIRTVDGNALASKIITRNVDEILKDGVI